MQRGRPPVRFRPFVRDDVAVVAPWLKSSGLAQHEAVGQHDWASRLTSDPRIVGTVAELDGRAVGFIRLDLAPDRSAEVTLIVDPARRRRGLGAHALQEALRQARRRGLRRLFAVVDDSNRVAREFFLAAGFERTGVEVPGFVHLARMVHGAGRQPPLEIVP